ncbi:MAG: hypothetical protein WCE51_12250 [Chthoniobacterales bacterium]
MSMKIAIVGLGYVGLPLSLQFASSCATVLGIDVDSRKVELLEEGKSYIRHIEALAIAEFARGVRR